MITVSFNDYENKPTTFVGKDFYIRNAGGGEGVHWTTNKGIVIRHSNSSEYHIIPYLTVEDYNKAMLDAKIVDGLCFVDLQAVQLANKVPDNKDYEAWYKPSLLDF